ncbi:MAG: DNA mismatch repair protein MutL [Gammaproteobacteria bacterium]|nr:DNA mismatch repair protein MutL [Gammaproteobacteria bacterium]
MLPRIALLPDSVISQIAAGEVIERPFSVVKELVENSIDAGAGQIDVEVEVGGARLIRVRDDGGGVSREDMPLALRRHATSKLRSLTDLAALGTLGFRGEALASIGAVARLTLTSREHGSSEAWTVCVQGSADIEGPVPAARATGTTVEVRDLFFATPVRRRFLKSERTEFLHMQDWLRRAALASPHLGFSLTHNQQRALAIRPASSDAQFARRLEKICGLAFMRHARPVGVAVPGLAVRGWIAAPAGARNQSDLQFWFVNGRPVRDPRLQHAARLAYEDALAAGRHPAYVLYLEIDPQALDVNVHPAKIEVRFADTRRVHDFVFSALRRVLRGPDPTPARAPPADGSLAGPEQAAAAAEPAPEYSPKVAARAAVVGAGEEPPSAAGPSLLLEMDKVMALPGGLIVVREASGLLLIDAQRARAALWLDALREAGDPLAMTPRLLLFPCAMSVDEEAADAIERVADALPACGVELERVAPGAVMLRAVPAALREVPARAVLDGVLQAGAESHRQRVSRQAAILEGIARAGGAALAPTTDAEAAALLRELAGRYDVETMVCRGIAGRAGTTDLRGLLAKRA